MRARSLAARFLLGAVLWTMGLFALLAPRYSSWSRSTCHGVLRIQHWVVLGLLALVCHAGRALAGADGLALDQPAARDASAPCATGAAPRIDGALPGEVQPLVDDLNALLEHRETRGARARWPRPATSRTA